MNVQLGSATTTPTTKNTLKFKPTFVRAGVGQQRLMPHGLYAQEKACKQEERLLERLQSIDLDPTLLRVLQRQVTLLLEGEWLRCSQWLTCSFRP